MKDVLSRMRQLPRVDDILNHEQMSSPPGAPRALARQAAREAVDEARSRVLAGEESLDLSPHAIAARAVEILHAKSARSLRRAINATGVILHTNLGRAPLSDSARQALAEVAAGYCNLQADAESGARSHREFHVEGLLREITGAEAALVVNNNAAATVLVLNTLAAGREVIVSRGEMVEIGGAFRIPDIMKLSGCRLVEVGCTNRTHLADYERAITPATALILSVHQSNYRIVGFASQVPVAELANLAHSRGLLCAHDLGSGALLDLRRYGLPHEPSAPESLAAAADAALFSGDKLLGGPQCGIILGKADAIAGMRKNPFYRTFRVCKLTLAALEATLRLFLDPDNLLTQHRLLALMGRPVDDVRKRAEILARRMREECGAPLSVEVRDGESEVGGGSLAGYSIPTVLVRLRLENVAASELLQRLRLGEPPVFARVQEASLLLDPRTMLDDEDELLLIAVHRAVAGLSSGACCPLRPLK